MNLAPDFLHPTPIPRHVVLGIAIGDQAIGVAVATEGDHLPEYRRRHLPRTTTREARETRFRQVVTSAIDQHDVTRVAVTTREILRDTAIVEALLAWLQLTATERNLALTRYDPKIVKQAFVQGDETATNRALAEALARRFEELRPHAPSAEPVPGGDHLPLLRRRAPSDHERYWHSVFLAVGVADLVAANGPMPCPPDDDDDDPPPAAPSMPAAVEPGAVSAIAGERIRLQEDWIREAGFALAPPLYAPGTRVLPLGDHNFRTERRRVEALPPFPGASSATSAAIRQESRRDRTFTLHELALTEHGTLMLGDEEHALEIGAFYQLAQHVGFGMGARYLAQMCDGELRADNVNAQLKKAKSRTLSLRTRQGSDDLRTVFATVTPAYAPVDTDQVLGAVAPMLTDARAEVLYDGSGVKATALWMPDQVVDLAAGDIFKAGVRIETDDTGRGRIRISAVVFRNRCLNLLIIGEGSIETVSAVHKGDPSSILARVRAGMDVARAKVADFLHAWGHARTVKVDPEETIRRFVQHNKLLPRGMRDTDLVVASILAAWRHEPGNTLADTVNAVTRAAHQTPTWGMDFREELERRAASLVLVPR